MCINSTHGADVGCLSGVQQNCTGGTGEMSYLFIYLPLQILLRLKRKYESGMIVSLLNFFFFAKSISVCPLYLSVNKYITSVNYYLLKRHFTCSADRKKGKQSD